MGLETDLDHVLAHTHSLWDDLRGSRIFITGGTGFFGCWLLESFLWANTRLDLRANAWVLTRDPDRFRAKAPHLAQHPSVTLCAGDIRTFMYPEGVFPFMIHAVTEESPIPLERFDSNVEGTRHVLEFARLHGAQRMLFTSSGAVYGKQPSDMTHVDETYAGAPDPMEAGSAYGLSKRIGEFLCADYARSYAFEIAIARCFAFVGPYLPFDSNFAVGNFIRDALHGGPIQIGGDGTPHRSYLYAADLAIWLWTMLFRAPSIRPYNVGVMEDLFIHDLADTVRKIVCPDAVIKVAQPPVPGTLPARYVPSTVRAQKELGLSSHIDLAEGIRRTAAFAMHEKKSCAQNEK